MASRSLAHFAHPVPEETRKPRGSACAGCGDLAGSISEGTDFPLVRDKESGLMHHVRCLPVRATSTRYGRRSSG
jgi:hypothetical protein